MSVEELQVLEAKYKELLDINENLVIEFNELKDRPSKPPDTGFVPKAKFEDVIREIPEWSCNCCKIVHPAPLSFDLCCPTDGCEGFLKASTFTEREQARKITALTAQLSSEQYGIGKAEPVAYQYRYINSFGDEVVNLRAPVGAKILESIPLYAAPQPSEPVAAKSIWLAEVGTGVIRGACAVVLPELDGTKAMFEWTREVRRLNAVTITVKELERLLGIKSLLSEALQQLYISTDIAGIDDEDGADYIHELCARISDTMPASQSEGKS